MSALWPSRTRAFTAPTWMTRAKTWASGRNSRVEAVVVTVRGEQLVELVDRHAQLGHEVAVGEHAALGAAGGAGGVDDRGEVERGGRRTPCLELVVGDVGAEPGQHVDRVVLDRPDVPQLVEVGADLGDPAQVRGALGDHRARAGVAEDVADLRRPTTSRRRGRPPRRRTRWRSRPASTRSGSERSAPPGLRRRHRRRRVPWPRREPGPGTRAAVTSDHSSEPGRRRPKTTASGASAALWTTSSVRFPVAGSPADSGPDMGVENSRTPSPAGPGCRASIGGEATVRRPRADC